jgi:tRNA (guanine-N7-)-methyltransferase
MKPKDLKYPYSWNERRPLLQDGLFFLPDYYLDHQKHSQLSWNEIFENNHPVCVEYCSGNGQWIIQKALDNPDKNWVAVEKRFDRVQKIYSKTQNQGIKNLFIVSGEAFTLSQNYFLPGSVDEIFINFPDPWPKDRHAKHRLVQNAFVEEMARTLKNNGHAMLVTDDDTYAEQMRREMACSFNSLSVATEGYGSSFFGELWKSKGRTINFLKYRKKSSN